MSRKRRPGNGAKGNWDHFEFPFRFENVTQLATGDAAKGRALLMLEASARMSRLITGA
jgi:hypothetical protein